MLDPREPLPVLVLRSAVVLPGEVKSFEISHEENVQAVLRATDGELAALGVRRQRQGATPGNLATVAVACRVLERVNLPGGVLRVTVQGLHRARVLGVERVGETLSALLSEPLTDVPDSVHPGSSGALESAVNRVLEAVARRGDESSLANAEMLALNASDPWRLAELSRRIVGLEFRDELELIEAPNAVQRMELLAEAVERTSPRPGRASHDDDTPGPDWRSQRAVQLDADPAEREVRFLEERIATTPLSPAARELALRELAHLRRVGSSTRDEACTRNFLETLLEMPWDFDAEPPRVDFETVEETLSSSHTGLADVKNRVVEHLAVRLLARRALGTVLCFLGPPGTGKSSMGRAVAEALGRVFVQIPGGTVTEEEQLRGTSHRLVGSMPGAVVQSILRAGRVDPVILIDEIDKLELGGSGTAGGALLDLLDPEQNSEFIDHYLGVPYDLSRCIFIVTANDRDDISEGVLDRLEIIEFGGFTEGEKLSIAREHLLEKARELHGLEREELRISPAALRTMVRNYTEEAGVRHLQRLHNSLARKAAVGVVRGRGGLYVRKADLLSYLGPAVVEEEYKLRRPALGVATGLAWTSAGGTLLPVEALAMIGSGRTILTGMIGEVMRESVQTAISYVRTRFTSMKVRQDVLDTLDLHLHFPSGATPKDGPSAGIAIAVALVSLMARIPVRHDVAATGEVSLHGNVLPIGGLKEKLLAAVRAGISEVIVPERNRQEVLRLPAEVRDNLVIHLISHVQDAFDLVLSRPLKDRVPRSLSQRAGRRRRTARGARQKKPGDAS